MSSRREACKVYVGDLPRDATEKEVEKAFRDFDGVKSVWVARNPPGFAFVEFENERDAKDAVHELDGSVICGVRSRVELSTGRSRPKPWVRDGRGGRRGRPFDADDRCYECGQKGHYAYDCSRRRSDRDRDRRHSRDRRSRSYSR